MTGMLSRGIVALAACAWLSAAAAAQGGGAAQTRPAEGPTEDDRAAAAEVRRLADGLKAPAAIEILNWQAGPFSDLLAVLAGEQPADAGRLAHARREVSRRLKELRSLDLKDFPPPRRLVIRRARKPVAVDGKLDEEAWKDATAVTEFHVLNTHPPRTLGDTELRMLWDERHLYVGAACRDESIEAPKLPRDGPVYDHDCIEVFLLPSMRWGLYWELNLSPSGSILDALQCKYRDRWGSYSRMEETMEGLRFAFSLTGPAEAPDGYVIEAAVPWEELPGWAEPPRSGRTLQMLVSRVDRTGSRRVFSAVTPITAWFHNVWCYATAELAD